MVDQEPSPLTAAQRQIMEVVWSRGGVTVSEVCQAINARRPVARNTIHTMIVRLEEKGWLTHQAAGRTFVYTAARPRTSSLGAKVAQLVDRFFAGSPEKMVTALIEYRGLTADEAERIRLMLEAAESSPRSPRKPRSK